MNSYFSVRKLYVLLCIAFKASEFLVVSGFLTFWFSNNFNHIFQLRGRSAEAVIRGVP